MNNFLDFFHLWHDYWPWPVQHLIRFWSIFVVTLTYIFQGQIWNLLYLSQKWSDCHETKSKYIDWTLGLKCDHRVWPWPWPSPWIFKVKYRICYISANNGPIATIRKANISIELYGSNVTIGFDLDHDLDLEFSRSNMEFPISQPKVVRLPRNEKQTFWLNSRPQMWPMVLTLTITLTFEFWRSNVTLAFDDTRSWPWNFVVKIWNSCISEWEGRLTLHKGSGSRSLMTMTIWWPRSGVWLYQIVTGVTSVVGVPSTHLVCQCVTRGHRVMITLYHFIPYKVLENNGVFINGQESNVICTFISKAR